MTLFILSHAYLLSVYLLWGTCSGFFACLLNWFILSDKFVHFGHKSFILHVIFTYFLPAWHVFLLPWKCLLQFKCFKYSLSNFLSYTMLSVSCMETDYQSHDFLIFPEIFIKNFKNLFYCWCEYVSYFVTCLSNLWSFNNTVNYISHFPVMFSTHFIT